MKTLTFSWPSSSKSSVVTMQGKVGKLLGLVKTCLTESLGRGW